MSGDCACAPFPWVVVVAPCCHSTPFLLSCQKKRCRAAKEKRFEASTSPWWAHPPLPFGRKPQRDRLVRQIGLYSVGRPGAQVSLTQSAVMLGLCVRGRGGRDRTAAVAAPKSAFLWGSTPFLCARAKKWGGIGSRGDRLLPRKTAHTHQPPAKVGRGTSRLPTCSAHANGGATGVKKALFFGGSTPFLWASTKEMGSNRRTGQRQPPSVSAHTHKVQE